MLACSGSWTGPTAVMKAPTPPPRKREPLHVRVIGFLNTSSKLPSFWVGARFLWLPLAPSPPSHPAVHFDLPLAFDLLSESPLSAVAQQPLFSLQIRAWSRSVGAPDSLFEAAGRLKQMRDGLFVRRCNQKGGGGGGG